MAIREGNAMGYPRPAALAILALNAEATAKAVAEAIAAKAEFICTACPSIAEALRCHVPAAMTRIAAVADAARKARVRAAATGTHVLAAKGFSRLGRGRKRWPQRTAATPGCCRRCRGTHGGGKELRGIRRNRLRTTTQLCNGCLKLLAILHLTLAATFGQPEAFASSLHRASCLLLPGPELLKLLLQTLPRARPAFSLLGTTSKPRRDLLASTQLR
mmetsp:Transcript_45168/g.98227  ORF Transcript_45168/g.98227 Transcript_45168/m.98227 type:complete len:217 (-) Transcript_45168:1997-2647(-)